MIAPKLKGTNSYKDLLIVHTAHGKKSEHVKVDDAKAEPVEYIYMRNTWKPF